MGFLDKKNAITSSASNLVYFPSMEDVMEGDLVEHEKVFIPIFSINLQQLNPQWTNELVHMIWFEEDPYHSEAAKYFTEHCTDCRIGFDHKNGKYTFQTDFKYFDLSEDWKEHFESEKSEIVRLKDKYLENGDILYWDTIKLGGQPEWWQANDTPMDSKGNEMEFIGQCEIINKMHYLFYSPKDKVVVQLYQIT